MVYEKDTGDTQRRNSKGSAKAQQRLIKGSSKAQQRLIKGSAKAQQKLSKSSEKAQQRLYSITFGINSNYLNDSIRLSNSQLSVEFDYVTTTVAFLSLSFSPDCH